MTPLRRQMIEDMTARGFAQATHSCYLHAVFELARFYSKSPDLLSAREVQRFLVHLVEQRGFCWSTLNCYAHGLRFFYGITLGRGGASFHIPCAKQPQRLPEVLSRKEVRAIICAAKCPRDRALLATVYGAGLRVSEVVQLRIADIDSERMSLRIQEGKRKKDRYALLSKAMLGELRRYWRASRPEIWLFPGAKAGRPITRETASRLFHAAKAEGGITKQGGIHSLRHAFATHQLEDGVDLHTIQRLLGHGAIRSTLRYFHLSERRLLVTASPLDRLELENG